MSPDDREYDEKQHADRTGSTLGPTADQLSEGAENASPEHDSASGMVDRDANQLEPETGATPREEREDGPDPEEYRDRQIDR